MRACGHSDQASGRVEEGRGNSRAAGARCEALSRANGCSAGGHSAAYSGTGTPRRAVQGVCRETARGRSDYYRVRYGVCCRPGMDALLVVPAPMKAMNEERPHRNFKGVWICAALWTHPKLSTSLADSALESKIVT